MIRCLEKKILLSGDVHTYSCELLRLDTGFGILKYVIDREYRVGTIRLKPGDITYAFYWKARPYTLYTWHLRESGRVLYYFNIADRISLSPNEFTWRDLVVDILVDDRNRIYVLDEDELPGTISPHLLKYIHEAATLIKNTFPVIIRETEILLSDIL